MSTDKIWRCACGGPHFLSIQVMPLSDGAEAYLSVVETYDPARETLWGRLRAAWTILRNRHFDGMELILEPDVARQIALELHRAARRVGLSRVQPPTP